MTLFDWSALSFQLHNAAIVVKSSGFYCHFPPCGEENETISPEMQCRNINPKMNILSSFTHPQVVLNLDEFLFSSEHKKRLFEECE